jgi:hypothetical protein
MAMEASTTEASVPEDFICPLTLEVMETPCMTRAGHNFERKAILQWLVDHNECPLTRNVLTLKDIIVNRNLRSKIQAWKKRNGHFGKAISDINSIDEHDSWLCCEISDETPFLLSCDATKEIIQCLRERSNDEGGKVLLQVLLNRARCDEQRRRRASLRATAA